MALESNILSLLNSFRDSTHPFIQNSNSLFIWCLLINTSEGIPSIERSGLTYFIYDWIHCNVISCSVELD